MTRERSSICVGGGGIALLCGLIGATFLFTGEDVILSLAFFGLGVAAWALLGSRLFVWSETSRSDRKREAASTGKKARRIDPVELRKWRERNPSYSLTEAVEKYWEENR